MCKCLINVQMRGECANNLILLNLSNEMRPFAHLHILTFAHLLSICTFSHLHISILNLSLKAATALVLFRLKVLPLILHLIIEFEFGIALCIFIPQLLINRYQVSKQ